MALTVVVNEVVVVRELPRATLLLAIGLHRYAISTILVRRVLLRSMIDLPDILDGLLVYQLLVLVTC